jgi:hypothetical protein
LCQDPRGNKPGIAAEFSLDGERLGPGPQVTPPPDRRVLIPDPVGFFQDVYAAFNARDIDTVLAHVTDDVDWPNAWKGGRLVGKRAVRDYWLGQWAEIDPHVEPHEVHERSDGRFAVTVRQTVRSRDGELLVDGDVVHVYVLRDGMIRRMDVERSDGDGDA